LSEQTYNLVYAGAVQLGFKKEQVKANFVSQLKIPHDKVDKLFSGKMMTLKKSLDKNKAELWQQKLLAIGAETAMVPCADPQLAIAASSANFELSPIVDKPSQVVNKEQQAQKNTQINTLTNTQADAQTSAQSEYDEDMKARILKAQAMIATQQLAMQLEKKKESSPMKRLFMFTGVLCLLIFMLYFYAGSMT